MKTLVFFLATTLAAQVADKANERYTSPEGRKAVAAGLVGSGRDARQRPKELVAALNIKPGMTVVDLGTGAGYLLPYLSEAVGPTGKVLAQDIFPDFLDRAKAASAKLRNVQFVLGDARHTNLPAASADLIVALDVYHHIDFPAELLADLHAKLKPKGRLAIVEFHKNETSMPGGNAMQHIRLPAGEAIQEIEANRFTLVHQAEFTPKVQWLAIFEPRSE